MKTSNSRFRGSIVGSIGFIAAMVLVVGCGGGAASGPILGSGVDDEGAYRGSPPGEQGTDTAGGNDQRAQVLDAARADLLIIKTGTLELQVKDVGVASKAAADAIASIGGYVSGSQQSGEGVNTSALVTYRIPSDRWDEALAAMRSLGLKVVSEATQTEDVTGQVVDLTARITNLEATERALQSIMTQATKISDILAVQTELTNVRGDIEQATATKQHLQEQASFSTLTVHFGLQPTAAIVISQQKFDPKDQVDRAAASLTEILQGIATAGIWFGIVWLPILIVLGFIALGVIFVLRRRGPPRATTMPATTIDDADAAPSRAIEPDATSRPEE